MKENNEIRSSAHSKYRCQYHIVFAPKFRRKEIYGKRNQLEEDYAADQISIKEFTDPFTGDKRK